MGVLLLLAIGLVAGVAGGLFGIGGGILIVPALIGLAGFGQQRAQGTSLVALLAPVGILGLLTYWRAGQADLRAGGFIAAGFVFGAFFGARVAVGLSEITMRRIFAAFLIAVAIWLLARK